MVWSTERFQKIGGPGSEWIAKAGSEPKGTSLQGVLKVWVHGPFRFWGVLRVLGF